MLVEVFEPERPRARWYCACAYLAPALVVLASAAAFPGGYGTARHCWLSTDRMFVMSFVGPVALVLVVSVCLKVLDLRVIIASTAVFFREYGTDQFMCKLEVCVGAFFDRCHWFS